MRNLRKSRLWADGLTPEETATSVSCECENSTLRRTSGSCVQTLATPRSLRVPRPGRRRPHVRRGAVLSDVKVGARGFLGFLSRRSRRSAALSLSRGRTSGLNQLGRSSPACQMVLRWGSSLGLEPGLVTWPPCLVPGAKATGVRRGSPGRVVTAPERHEVSGDRVSLPLRTATLPPCVTCLQCPFLRCP